MLQETKKTFMSPLQKKAARPKCRKLLQKYGKVDFIIDDESYFTLSNTTLAGNDRFYSNNLQTTPGNVRYKYKSKYEPKLLVWIAISPRGKSRTLFLPSGLAVNQQVYKESCLKERLVPFIKQYYQDGKYVFWPDLASSHYAHSVQDYLRRENINYVPKLANPANVSKVRAIEDFWGILKQKVYENNWQAKNIVFLKKRITWCLSKFEPKLLHTITQSVVARLRTVDRKSLDSL